MVHGTYMAELMEEVFRQLQTEGYSTIGNLSLKFQLPLDLMSATVKSFLSDGKGKGVIWKVCMSNIYTLTTAHGTWGVLLEECHLYLYE